MWVLMPSRQFWSAMPSRGGRVTSSTAQRISQGAERGTIMARNTFQQGDPGLGLLKLLVDVE